MAWSVAVAVLTALALVRARQPDDIFGGLLPRHRSVPDHLVPHDDLSRLSHITPCSVTDDADPNYYYPDFPECRDNQCEPCKPLHHTSSVPEPRFHKVQPIPPSPTRPAVVPDPYLQIQSYPSSPAILPDLSRHQIEPHPDYLTVIPNPNLPQIQPGPGYTYPQIVNPPLPTVVLQSYPPVGVSPSCFPAVYSYQPEVCPTYSLAHIHVPPHQCSIISPTNFSASRDQILRIIYEGGHFQGSLQCRASVSELLLRLTLIEDRLRALVKSETRLKIYTDILAQIQFKVGEKRPGNIGSVGAQGYKGPRGTRGSRGLPGRCITIGRPIDVTGRPGPAGPKGVTGPPGDKICDCDGTPGALGFRGYNIPGSPGPKGFKGQKGRRGYDYNPMSDLS